MLKRPKPSDTEEDILRMQEEFLREQSKENSKFAPASQVIHVERKEKKKSIFAERRAATVPSVQDSDESMVVEQSADPKIPNLMLGNVIEKNLPGQLVATKTVFRKPTTRNLETQKQSIFVRKLIASAENSESSNYQDHMEVEDFSSNSATTIDKSAFGEKSAIIQDENTGRTVHNENIDKLSKMSLDEIESERKKLLEALDPSLINFIKAKKTKVDELMVPKETNTVESIVDEPEELPCAHLLENEAANGWINFNVIEKEKLEWMKDVKVKKEKMKIGDQYEARFDWNGNLLPYTEEPNKNIDTRELYLHGEEPHRPGYTLQELFRLARAEVIQQRIAAINAIAGILNIYTQGYYDDILELPITKILFVLRFAMDDVTPTVVAAGTFALSVLLYNEPDEQLLDILYETSCGIYQPGLDVSDSADREVEPVEKLFKCTNDQEPNDEENSTDFQVAENNLIECILRMNIFQRIHYILTIMRPDVLLIDCCVKILIRIARTNEVCAKKIIEHEDILTYLAINLRNDLMKLDIVSSTSFPSRRVLKLFRVLSSYNPLVAVTLQNHVDMLSLIKAALYSRRQINVGLLAIQTEALRLLRCAMRIMNCNSSTETIAAFYAMLEWHYQNLEIDDKNMACYHQHAASLVCLLRMRQCDIQQISGLVKMLGLCMSKWFYIATTKEANNLSQQILLSSCLDTCSNLIGSFPEYFKEFSEKYLKNYLLSDSLKTLLGGIIHQSGLLCTAKDRSRENRAFPNIGSIIILNNECRLIIPEQYGFLILNSLLNSTLNTHLSDKVIIDYCSQLAGDGFMKSQLKHNWFMRLEINTIINLIQSKIAVKTLPRTVYIKLLYSLISCLAEDQLPIIYVLFENELFSRDLFENIETEELEKWKEVYINCCLSSLETRISVNIETLHRKSYNEPILIPDWSYTPLAIQLAKYLHSIRTDNESIESTEEDNDKNILMACLSYNLMLESCGIDPIEPVEKLMYFMICYLDKSCYFLDKDVKVVLRNSIDEFFKKHKNTVFNLDTVFKNKCNFENLYILFLNQFQAASYGDEYFSVLVMIPLSQRYPNKWKKMIWSEHVAALRYIRCHEDQLLNSIEWYLQPVETDMSLLQNFNQAINSKSVLIDSLPYKIATHHLNCFKSNHNKLN